MKAGEVIRGNCEKHFIVNALQNGIRLDSRQFYDYRKVKIKFGDSFGHCEVCIGSTRALAQVTCEVIKPSQNRPNEGQLFLNVELSPMASPTFESGRPSDQAVEINRFVERCLKESRPIDMESLCIIAGEKVWCLRVDVQILDDKGNILDCACIAAIAALAHFRRPDVTVNGKDITIHSFDDKEAIPLNVNHIPICISLGFISLCEKPIVDPTENEEFVLDGLMMVAINSHMEICCAKMCGVSISPEQVMMCCKIASSKVTEITDKVKNSLEKDRKKRFPDRDTKRKWKVGDDDANNILKSVAEPTHIDLTESVREGTENSRKIDTNLQINTLVTRKDEKTATIGEGGLSVWVISDDESIEEKDSDQNMTNENMKELNSKSNKRNHEQSMDYIELEDVSEEEDTVQLTSMDLDYENGKTSQNEEGNVDQVIYITDNKGTPKANLKTKKRKKKKKVSIAT